MQFSFLAKAFFICIGLFGVASAGFAQLSRYGMDAQPYQTPLVQNNASQQASIQEKEALGQAGLDSNKLGGSSKPSSGSAGSGGSCPVQTPGATCGGTGPASQGNVSGTNQGAGNPINVITGNKYQQEIDMPTLPGVLGLEIVRHYNSALSGVETAPGLVGRGWRLSYETYLVQQNKWTIDILQADGTRSRFERNPERAPDRLNNYIGIGGVVTFNQTRTGNEYLWRWPNGQELLFDEQGKLIQIKMRTGEFVTLKYNERGWLSQVTDPQNRSLEINYLSAAERQATIAKGDLAYAGLQSIKSPVGTFQYQYGTRKTDAMTVSKLELIANLVKVIFPIENSANQIKTQLKTQLETKQQPVERHYHFEHDQFPTLLTGISIKGAGSDGVFMHERLSSYWYDAQGRANLSVKGEPAQLAKNPSTGQMLIPKRLKEGTGIEQVTLTWPKSGTTILANSLGQQTIYQIKKIAGQDRIVQVTGAGCAACGPTNVRYGHDQEARIIESTQFDTQQQPLQSIKTDYDQQGRVIQVSQIDYLNGRPTSAQWLTRYEYSESSGDLTSPNLQPSLIAQPSVVKGLEYQVRLTYNERGQVASQTESGYSPLTFDNTVAKVKTEATPIKHTTTFSYTIIDGKSVLTQIDGPLANGPKVDSTDSDVVGIEYNLRGVYVNAISSPNGGRSVIKYDDAGRIIKVIATRGNATFYTNGTMGQLLNMSSSGPEWAAHTNTDYKYDANQRLTRSMVSSEKHADGETGHKENNVRKSWAQGYDLADRLTWQASSLGVLKFKRFDVEGHLLKEGITTNAMSKVTDFHRTETAQLVSASYNADRIVNLSFTRRSKGVLQQHLNDDFGRIVYIKTQDHGERVFNYDAANRLVYMRDANGHVGHYVWNLSGEIIRQDLIHGQSGKTTTVQWHRENGKLVAVDHPDQSERYFYNERGWRTAKFTTIKQPDGAQLSTVERYEHDGQGQLTATTLADGTWLRYEKNGQGQVIALTRARVKTPWLQPFENSRVLAKDFERDMVGLKSFISGNGVQSRFERSPQGDLARVVHRRYSQSRKPAVPDPQATPQDLLPGALSLPKDPQAIFDQRYLWDWRGNLRFIQSYESIGLTAKQSVFAYDNHDQLIAVQQQFGDISQKIALAQPVGFEQSAQTKFERIDRYAYDGHGRRVLAQEDVKNQDDLTGTSQVKYDANRWVHETKKGLAQVDETYDATSDATYDATGLPQTIGNKNLTWDAAGKLIRVDQGKESITYAYDHRGLRHTKSINTSVNKPASEQVHYVYDSSSNLKAEINQEGRITRQYVWLADVPIAVIDDQFNLADETASRASVMLHDLKAIVLSWVNLSDQTNFIHVNHLMAPQVMTDFAAKPIWKAQYEGFGKASTEGAITLNLRLPGQYKDQETGWHYNRQRYYDPSRGSYISPDPSGNPDGPNGYAYVRHNPLRYVDADGLLLFAFDGTGNTNNASDLAEVGNDLSNVWKFRQLYNSGNRRYVTGVGTRHRETEAQFGSDIAKNWGNISTADMIGNDTGPSRIFRMVAYFNAEMELENQDSKLMDIDIIGFSRGAAQARDFANQINANTRNGQYNYTRLVKGKLEQRCQMINFRFMGLWDTVLSANLTGHGYNLAIVPGFQYVAQAVALNEYRGDTVRRLPDSTGAFPLESIMGSNVPFGQERIERGFIGAHADIGGGFAGQVDALPLVTLSWMVEQARNAGVRMDNPKLNISTSAVIHDKSDNQYCVDGPGCPGSEDREVRGGRGGTQRRMTDTGMAYANTGQFINYFPGHKDSRGRWIRTPRADASTGTVDMARYLKWLRDNRYELGNLQVQ